MTQYILLISSFVFFSMQSCSKEDFNGSSTDYLIFGHFYGECMGESCIEIFKLEKDRILEDTRDIYPGSHQFYDGKYVQLAPQKFNQTKDLIIDFPEDLIKENNRVIGQPDAGDWGGLYIEYNFEGTRKFWLLDQMKSNVPDKYHRFIDEVNEKIAVLQ